MSYNKMSEFELARERDDKVFEHENILRSCCFYIDRRILDYALKIGVTCGIMTFACVQISKNWLDF